MPQPAVILIIGGDKMTKLNPRIYEDALKIQAQLTALKAENEQLITVLVELLEATIILSDKHIDVLEEEHNKQWRRLFVAARKAHTALETAVIDRANKADIQETEQFHSNDILGFG